MLVVGGGAVGMALALAANKDGKQVELLGLPAGGAGRFYALGTAAVDFLSDVMETPLPPCALVRRFLLSADGKQQYLQAKDGALLCRIISENALLQWLQNGIEHAGVRQHKWQTQNFIGYQQTDAGVMLKLHDGQELSARMVVAADGPRSPTAKAFGIGASVRLFGQKAVSLRLKIPALADDTAGQWFAPRDILALLPAGDGVFALVWSMPTAAAASMCATGAAEIAQQVQARTGYAVTAIEDETPRSFVLSSIRRAVRVAPNTAFVGDAARVIHPLAGQGLNIGLADASLLLRCRQQNLTVAAALAEYATHAHWRGAQLNAITTALNRGGRLLSPLLAIAAYSPFGEYVMRRANQ